MAAVVRVAEHMARRERVGFASAAINSVVVPALYLAAMGLGLGTLVDDGSGADTIEGLAYKDFVAPGLLALAAMQTAGNLCTWPVLGGLKWQRTYHAIMATPTTVSEVVLGHLGWLAVRFLLSSIAFAVVLVPFGVVASASGAVIAVVVATLTGLAFAGPITAFAGTRENDQGFNYLHRFVLVPLFLFSGAFFPVEQMPAALEAFARITPSYHGVVACRQLVGGTGGLVDVAGSVAYLTAVAVVGAWLAVWVFRRRLER